MASVAAEGDRITSEQQRREKDDKLEQEWRYLNRGVERGDINDCTRENVRVDRDDWPGDRAAGGRHPHSVGVCLPRVHNRTPALQGTADADYVQMDLVFFSRMCVFAMQVLLRCMTHEE